MTPTPFSIRALLLAAAAQTAFIAAGPAAHAADATSGATTTGPAACMADLAQTRAFSLGLPNSAAPTPDGRSVLFLRSGPRDTTLHLYRYDTATKQTTELARPDSGPEHLTVEERAQRERARQSLTGITHYLIAPDSQSVIATLGGHLERIDLATGKTTPIPGSWISPRLAPDGRHIAAVKDDDLYSIDLATGQATRLTSGGSETLTHGLAEFAAAEELQREDGTWWSPDSQTLLYEEADSTGVEPHYIANLGDPAQKPTEFRYPRAGTANAKTRLGLMPSAGGPTHWIDWDHDRYPYIARIAWRKTGGLFVVLLNRAETEELVLAVDPATGATREVLHDTDAQWLSLTPWEGSGGHDLPVALADGPNIPQGGFLWAAQRGPHWQLELHDHDGHLVRALTPQSLPFVALNNYDAKAGTVLATVQTSRIDTGLVRIDLATGQITTLVATPGVHRATFTPGGHSLFVDTFSSADGTRQSIIRTPDGTAIGTLPPVAEKPTLALHTEFTTLGADDLDSLIIRPDNFNPNRHYPVLLSVYAGPGYKTVWHTPASYYEDQCLANQGFIVTSFDGHGTPGRDHDFERATKNDVIDLPLHDQVEGLQAAGRKYRQIDLARAGVYGWSFGGYFTAMATIRRPDVFKAGNAGAPPVDWTDYDTAYTERYLGTPQSDPDGYHKSDVLTYAPNLSRPLLIMHGATDDNVYFENTMKLTQSLLAAGRPYNLLLLPGTHMLPNPQIRLRVSQARAEFFKQTLGSPR
ncbi:DPP IV N-terminal domain-containing protein [Tanticharoenia sakaeratensis]|uniref:Dipeptidyl peptidase IV n=1 Tax=Tanticharoenia sakaeratensis NBRC 103193 TaxID=1231623 RepID=A0A0D6MNP3_9PROT|nr:DPP IV N-terminal domain-containing protein [Tanticharoenia sakaeratensis]GAN55284.1 dipeptidyl peptidase IV [Tanticharoenia sakaeratensis NBRC 103193]GBQ25564.1 dipeptidyl peptidase IV [Tanticharoenia sakaeratensis NBRC 103193]